MYPLQISLLRGSIPPHLSIKGSLKYPSLCTLLRHKTSSSRFLLIPAVGDCQDRQRRECRSEVSVSQCRIVWGYSRALYKIGSLREKQIQGIFSLNHMFPSLSHTELSMRRFRSTSGLPLSISIPNKRLEPIQCCWLLLCAETLPDLDFEGRQLYKWNADLCVSMKNSNVTGDIGIKWDIYGLDMANGREFEFSNYCIWSWFFFKLQISNFCWYHFIIC